MKLKYIFNTATLSYRTKLALAILSVGFSVFLFSTAYQITFLKNALIERTLSRIKTVEAILNDSILENLIDKDIKSIQRLIDTTVKQPLINFISIVDTNNIVIFSTDNILENEINPYKDSSNIKQEKTTFVKSSPLEKSGEKYGYIQIGFSLKKLKEDVTTAKYSSLAINLIILVILIGVARLISDKLLDPLKEMKNISDAIAKGDFSKRIDIKSKDVIGNLGISLNNMAEQLNDLTHNLNEKIRIATQELETSNKKLKEIDKAKSEFVSMVSHELRTPLTAIIGFAKTLQTLTLSEEKKNQYLTIIETEGKRLASLIEEFLDISRIESGKMELHFVKVNILDLVNEILNSSNIFNTVTIDVKFPVGFYQVEADKDGIKQVLINILSNAVKYTPQGNTITITGTENIDYIEIRIKDAGPGIKKDDIEKIFDRFYRINDDISIKNRGSGLGLSISKYIIELHNGEIWAESELGKGSTFVFILPKKK